MRAFWGLLISVLLLCGQILACRSVLLCDDGKVCNTATIDPCGDHGVAVPEVGPRTDLCGELTENSSDCADCCRVSACPDTPIKKFDHAKPDWQSPVTLIKPSPWLPLVHQTALKQQLLQLGAAMPRDPPPGVFSSRAPPVGLA